MGKLYSFSKADATDVAFSNAVTRCNLVLYDVIALLDEEMGRPQQTVVAIAYMRASTENGVLLTTDKIPLICCADGSGRMDVSPDEVVTDFVDFILQLPPAFLAKIRTALISDPKLPQDAPESNE